MNISILIENYKSYPSNEIKNLPDVLRTKVSALFLTLSLLLATTQGLYAQPVGGMVVAWGYNHSGQTNVPNGLNGVMAIAAGASHTVVLQTNGTVVAWGYNYYGQTNIPAGLSGVVAIAAGYTHTVALKSNGTVVAWGYNYYGQTNVPAGLGGVIAIAAGLNHTVALKTNGTVVAWGQNYYGQTTVPSSWRGVKAIAAGYDHTVALHTNGWVMTCGLNTSGQTTIPPGLSGVTAIAAGYANTVALRSNGTVVAWGDNSGAQTNVPASLTEVQAVAVGGDHTVALHTDGTVVVWGDNSLGETNVPAGLSRVMAIAAGLYHNVALVPVHITSQPASISVNLTSNATLSVTAIAAAPLSYQWRKDVVDVSGATNASLELSNVQTNQAGSYTVVVTNVWGSVTSRVAVLTVNRLAQTINFGSLPVKQMGDAPFDLGATASSGLPVSYTNSNPDVATVSGNTVTITGVGSTTITASQTGNALYLPAGNVSRTINVAPFGITSQPVSGTVNVTSNATFTVGGSSAAPLSYQWRKDVVIVSGATNATFTLSNVQTNQAGNYTVVITNIWGSMTSSVAVLTVNRLAQTINFDSLPGKQVDDAPFTLGTTASSGLPVSYTSSNPGVATVSGNTVSITGLGSTTIIASQAGNATFLPAANVAQIFRVAKVLGSVVAWGYNFSGQTNVPANLSEVVSIAAGFSHTVALQIDGTVVAWGDNGYGQTNVPGALTSATAIAAGGYHTVALNANGNLVAWGNNGFGQASVPAGLGVVTAIAAGYYHTVALRNDGTVLAWGDNRFGQTNVPAGLSGVTAIAAGRYHTVVLQSDGTALAWGLNTAGQTTVPAALNGVTAIAAGDSHTLALRGNGKVVAWGDNSFGQTNVPVSGLSGVKAIAAGGFHTLGLKTNNTPIAWGDNDDGQTTVPSGLSGVMAIAGGGYHTVAIAPAVSPSITAQPASLTVNANSNAAFSVTAMGTGPLIYQWVKDEVDVSGANSPALNFIATSRSFAGTYSVRVSNSAGTITSSNATLRVLVPQRMETPLRLADGRMQLTSRDDGGSGVPDDLRKLILISTDSLNGTNTLWTTNLTTTGFSINNGYLLIEDVGTTNAVQRFYRVIEW